MAKYAGNVCYVTEVESPPGVWRKEETVVRMYGDILRTASVFQGAERINKNITLQNRISLLANSIGMSNFYNIQWIEYLGTKWEVTLIDIVSPRIIVTLGGIWNG